MRLDKFLSQMGYGSRKDVKLMLKKQNIKVNDIQIKDGKYGIDERKDKITVNGETVVYQKYVYYMLNKPKNVVSATQDREHRTVLDLLSDDTLKKDVFPVGRLDKDTTGLLLLTNDGDLAHQLLSPKKKVPKLYKAHIAGVITPEDVKQFEQGHIKIDGDYCLPAKITIQTINESNQTCIVDIEIMEGKYHQVKRMVHYVGKEVVELERLKMGQLELDHSLKRGEYKAISETEIYDLLGI